MRTEYDVIDTNGPQKQQKSKRERRQDASKRRAAKVCAICKHPDVDHQNIKGVDAGIRYCHACNDKCPYAPGLQRRIRQNRLDATPADLDGKGGAPVGDSAH